MEDDEVPIQDDGLGEVDEEWFDALQEEDFQMHVEQVVVIADLDSSLMDDPIIHEFLLQILKSHLSWFYGDDLSPCSSSMRFRGVVLS